MIITTEGIIFKSVKTVNNRLMLSVFTRKFGKINVGTGLSGKNKKKTELFLKPFTLSNYHIYKNNDFFNLNYGDVKKSYFDIGADVDKYIMASSILEISEKILPENVSSPKLFDDLVEYFDLISQKKVNYSLISISYKLKLLKELGYLPDFKSCVYCNKVFDSDDEIFFNLLEGEILCNKCKKTQDISNDTLIYDLKFDIVGIINFLTDKSMETFKSLLLEDEIQSRISNMLTSYLRHHLSIDNLKSESLFDCR